MENTISLFRVAHRVALSALLLLMAAIPLITTINLVTAFVILPVFLIFVFTLSIVIEQKLDSLSLNNATIKKSSTCLIKRCLHNSCFG